MKLDIRNKQDVPTCRYAKVFLDGTELARCIAADEEAGTAEAYCVDDQGKTILDLDHHCEPRVFHFIGKVRIELAPEGREVFDLVRGAAR